MNDVIDQINLCSGCTACMNICPRKCISMIANNEGFLYPKINMDNCIHCGLCRKTCPVLKKQVDESVPKALLVKHKDDNVRLTSSSGGVFQAIAEKILQDNGIVVGAYYDYEKRKVVHGLVSSIEELEKLKGSKYVQSDLQNIFLEIKKKLSTGKKVFFVGTACQVAGLYAYLGQRTKNLVTCDFICHGVPSPKVFSMYFNYLEKEYNSTVTSISFRNKDTGWKKFSVKFCFENGQIYQKQFLDDIYMQGFLQNLFLRTSCSSCSFKSKRHISDITIGDFWGINNKYKTLNDDKGVSVVFVNSISGSNILEMCKDSIDVTSCTFDEAVRGNNCLYNSVKMHRNRTNFFEQLETDNIDMAIKQNLTKDTILKKTIKIVFNNLKRGIKND